jgi:beta-N-acetylhexosaminidase
LGRASTLAERVSFTIALCLLTSLSPALAFAESNPVLERDAGRLFLVSPDTRTPPDWEYWVREARVCGLVLERGKHYDTPDELAQLCRAVRALADGDFEPPLIFARHDGGAFAALPSMLGGAPDPGPLALAAAGAPAAAREAYAAAARDLRACGVDGVVGPRAGMYLPPVQPELQLRTFGADPAIVSSFAAAAVEGLRAGGALACATGFPGGAVPLHDARDAPAWNLAGAWRENALAPSQALASAQADLLIVDHVRVPAWDPKRAAPYSGPMIQGLLREQLEYGGLIAAADMTSGPASEEHGPERTAVMALTAGCDLLCIERAAPKDFEVRRTGIIDMTAGGHLSEERVFEALDRVRGMMARAAGRREALPGPGAVYAKLKREERPLSGVTLVRGDNALLPLSNETVGLLVVCPRAAVEVPGARAIGVGTTLGAAVRARNPAAREERYNLNPAPWQRDAILESAGKAKVIVLGLLYTAANERQGMLATELLALDKPVILVALGDPGDLAPFGRAPVLLAACGFGEANYEATAAVLFGETKATGKLPLPIGDLYPAGHRAAE